MDKVIESARTRLARTLERMRLGEFRGVELELELELRGIASELGGWLADEPTADDFYGLVQLD
jgi:hypothetical protein